MFRKITKESSFKNPKEVYELGCLISKFHRLYKSKEILNMNEIFKQIKDESQDLQQQISNCFQKRLVENTKKIKKKINSLKISFKKFFEDNSDKKILEKGKKYSFNFAHEEIEFLSLNELEGDDEKIFLQHYNPLKNIHINDSLSNLMKDLGTLSNKNESETNINSRPNQNFVSLKDTCFLLRESIKCSDPEIDYLTNNVLNNSNYFFEKIYDGFNQDTLNILELERQTKNKNLLFLLSTKEKYRFGAMIFNDKKELSNIFQLSKKTIHFLKKEDTSQILEFKKEEGIIFGNGDLQIGLDPFTSQCSSSKLGNSFSLQEFQDRNHLTDGSKFKLQSLWIFEFF